MTQQLHSGVDTEEMKTQVHTKGTVVNVYSGIIMNSPKVETANCLSADERISEIWYVHIME